MTIKILFAAFLCSCIPKGYADVPAFKATIGSYNVANLWDADGGNTSKAWDRYLKLSGQGSHRRRMTKGKASKDTQYPQYDSRWSNYYDPRILQAKSDNIVKAIELAGAPDIFGLQELESAGNNSKVWEMPASGKSTLQKALEKLGYKYFYVGPQTSNEPVSVTPGMISKFPLTMKPTIAVAAELHSTSTRDIMVMEWALPGSRVLLMNGHLKSKRDGGDELRVIQAQAIRARVNEEKRKDPKVRVIVMGDLNSGYEDQSMQALGTTGNEASMLSEQSSPELLNLWFELDEENRWESTFGGVRGTLSHLLISDGFFNQYGLTYDFNSFHVVGQSGPEANELLTPEGVPFAWQQRRSGSRNFVHLGLGYSDHLPLVASFSYNPKPVSAQDSKRTVEFPFDVDATQPPQNVQFDRVQVCKESEAIDYKDINWNKKSSFYGKCVKVEVPGGLELQSRTRFYLSVISIPFDGNEEGKFDIGVSMSRSFDWHPNIDDSRVTYEEAAIQEGEFDSRHHHPHSNQCFLREVLEGQGGRVEKIVGRISYQNGSLAILAATREPKDIVLSHLSYEKRQACPW